MLTCLIRPTPGLDHVSSILMSNWHTQIINCHATRRRDWWPSCCTIWCGASDRPAFRSIPRSFLAHQSCRETLSFLLRSRNLLPLPHPWSISAYSDPPAPFLLDAGLQTPPGYCPRQVSQRWPVRTSSLLWVFPPCTVRYWVFTTQCIQSCLNEVISLGILCRQA